MPSKPHRLRFALIAVLGAFALFLVPGALAGKGGGGNSTTTPTATLYSSCNPCANKTFVHFWGSGYDPSSNGMAAVYNSSDGSTTWFAVPVWADGTTAFDLYMSPTGTYTVKILQRVNGKKSSLMGELDGLVVQ
jgi:hypothetical protein